MGRAYAALGGPLLTQCGDTSLFPQEPYLTIASGWEQGVNLEPGVPTTNHCTRSEPTTAQLTAKSAGLTDSGAVGPFARSIQFQAAALLDYAYFAVPLGLADPLLSLYVIRDDYSAPVVGSSGSPAADFSIVLNNTTPTSDLTVNPVPGTSGLYRVSVRVSGSNTYATAGVGRYAGQSGKGFRVMGFGFESGVGRTVPSRYKPTTGSIVTETNYYYPNSGIIQCARAVESTLANGLACSGSGVTWQVTPLLF